MEDNSHEKTNPKRKKNVSKVYYKEWQDHDSLIFLVKHLVKSIPLSFSGDPRIEKTTNARIFLVRNLDNLGYGWVGTDQLDHLLRIALQLNSSSQSAFKTWSEISTTFDIGEYLNYCF